MDISSTKKIKSKTSRKYRRAVREIAMDRCDGWLERTMCWLLAGQRLLVLLQVPVPVPLCRGRGGRDTFFISMMTNRPYSHHLLPTKRLRHQRWLRLWQPPLRHHYQHHRRPQHQLRLSMNPFLLQCRNSLIWKLKSHSIRFNSKDWFVQL